MEGVNPFAVTASPVFNLCNDGGQAINNPWEGAKVDTAKLEGLEATGEWVTVSLPIDQSELSSFFYMILLTDSCGKGTLSIRELRLTEDDRTELPGEKGDLVLDLKALSSGNGANGGTFTYSEATDELTIDYDGQIWGYWEKWKTEGWAADQSAIDMSAYSYVTMTVKMEGVNPFAVTASPVFNLCNDGGQAINNPWEGAKVDTAKLEGLEATGEWVTVSLPIDQSELSSFFYMILLTDSCGKGTLSIRELRLTEDDRTELPGEKGDLVLDLKALGSGYASTTAHYDESAQTLTANFEGMLWLYWESWKAAGYDGNAMEIGDYRYLTMRVKVEGDNPFAVAAAPTFNLCNDGGQALNNPWVGDHVGYARLKAVTPTDGWVTLSLPIDSSEYKAFFYAVMLCESCGKGSLSFQDLRLTEDDRTDEKFAGIEEEEDPDKDLKLDVSALEAGYESTTLTYDSGTKTASAEFSGMLWLYWQGWKAAGYDGSAVEIGDYKYLTMTVKVEGSNPFAVAESPEFNLCNDGGIAINAPEAGAPVNTTILKAVTQEDGWVTVSLPVDAKKLASFYYIMMRCNGGGEGVFSIQDMRLTKDDRTSIYTGPDWDENYGYWLDASGWRNQYPSGATGHSSISNDTLDIQVHGQIIYTWGVWDSRIEEDVVDTSDYGYLTFQVKLSDSNPFYTARKNGTACALYIGDEGGKQVSEPASFGSALMDNLCAVRSEDEWVTVSLSLENVEQSTLRYIYMVAENCGTDFAISIRNMCLTDTDRTAQVILDRVAEENEQDTGNTEEPFYDPDDTLDDYTIPTVPGGDKPDKDDGQPDNMDTGVQAPLRAFAVSCVAACAAALVWRRGGKQRLS